MLYFCAPLLPLPPEEIRRARCIAFLARPNLARLLELLLTVVESLGRLVVLVILRLRVGIAIERETLREG